MLEREAMAVLVSTAGISYGRREAALLAAGSALAVLEDPAAYREQLTAQGVSALKGMIRSGGHNRALDALSQRQVRLLMRGEAGYPQRLLEIAHPPHLLFVWGRAELDDPLSVAIVGTRRATDYGLFHTRTLARELAQQGVCIVSGLAHGVDAAAHRGALEASGRTVAVLGGALDRFYPEANRSLMRMMIDAGGSVVTEYPLGMAPTHYSFLHRNRIIAGLSHGVLVTEGARRSGALRTVHEALDCGREVFALPGDVRSEGSQLPHMLIRDGAQLITCAQDILDALAGRAQSEAGTDSVRENGAQAGKRPAASRAPGGEERMQRRRMGREDDGQQDARPAQGRSMPQGLGPEEAAVWQALKMGECDFDELCARTGMDSKTLGPLLTMMDMDGMVQALAGLRYRLA